MKIPKINPTKLYFSSLFIGIIIMICLITIVCKTLDFDRKSAFCLFYYGMIGFSLKSILFFIPYLMIYKYNRIKNLIIWLPLILFAFYYLSILMFKIEFLLPDFSYGYFMMFPHFYLQLISVLIVCIWMSVQLNKKGKGIL